MFQAASGSIHFQLEYAVITRGTIIEISIFKQSIIYIAYEASGDGSFENSLTTQGWSLVTNVGTIDTDCCTLTHIWKKFVSSSGLSVIKLPEIQINQFIFIFV